MKYLCPEVEKLVSNLEKKEDVYIFDTPANHEIYDLMWRGESQEEVDISQWGKNRIFLLSRLLLEDGIDFQNIGIVLDVCSGKGRFSVAALELRAKMVVSYDGSYNGLQHVAGLIKNKNIPENYDEKTEHGVTPSYIAHCIRSNIPNPTGLLSKNGSAHLFYEPLIKANDIKDIEKRHVSIQGDINNITGLFDKPMFDVIIHHMALHHTADYKKTLSDLISLLNPGGHIMFNFFNEGATSKIIYDLREIFLKLSPQLVYNFVTKFNKLEHRNLDSVQQILKEVGAPPPTLQKFSSLIEEHSFEEIIKNLHDFEDLQTPYLHNLNPEEVLKFMKNDMDMYIISWALRVGDTRIFARKK